MTLGAPFGYYKQTIVDIPGSIIFTICACADFFAAQDCSKGLSEGSVCSMHCVGDQFNTTPD
jgi:hypothetical protein